jgi:hypothetical protein
MKLIMSLSAILLASVPTLQRAPMTEEQKADAYIRAIQASQTSEDLENRLKGIDPSLQNRTWVLPTIFKHLSEPNAWDALCRVDQWGDGAWHLEMDAAAFEAFARDSKVFIDRYLSGDDCAFLLLMYAYRWPLEALEVGGIDCTVDGIKKSEQLDRGIKASHEVIISARPPATSNGRNRDQSLLQILATVEEAWWPQYDRFRKSCENDQK